MRVSLDSLLRTGYLGDLRSGMSKAEVQAILSAPDDTGGTSRRYPRPSIFLYGTVEIWFRQQPPGDLIGVWWEAGDKGVFHLTDDCVILDWVFTPEWTRARVEGYLRDKEIHFERGNTVPSLLLTSGVTISFQDGLLYGVSVSQ
jgi:hypothetical protein